MNFIRTLNNEWIKIIHIDKFEHKQVNDKFLMNAFIKDRRYVIRVFDTEQEIFDFIDFINEDLLILTSHNE